MCIFCLAISCVDLNSLRNIRCPAEWTGVNVPVVFKMKKKISKSRISELFALIYWRIKYLRLKYGLSLLKIHEKYNFRIIFYVSLIKNNKQEKEKKLTFLNHLLAPDNVFSTQSEEQEVNLMWPNLFLIFDCPSSVYTAHDHDLFRTLSKWISVDIKIIGQVCLQGSELKKSYI